MSWLPGVTFQCRNISFSSCLLFKFILVQHKCRLTTWWEFRCLTATWDHRKVLVDLFKVHMEPTVFCRGYFLYIWWYSWFMRFFIGFPTLTMKILGWTLRILYHHWLWRHRMEQGEWLSRCNCPNLMSREKVTIKYGLCMPSSQGFSSKPNTFPSIKSVWKVIQEPREPGQSHVFQRHFVRWRHTDILNYYTKNNTYLIKIMEKVTWEKAVATASSRGPVNFSANSVHI